MIAAAWAPQIEGELTRRLAFWTRRPARDRPRTVVGIRQRTFGMKAGLGGHSRRPARIARHAGPLRANKGPTLCAARLRPHRHGHEFGLERGQISANAGLPWLPVSGRGPIDVPARTEVLRRRPDQRRFLDAQPPYLERRADGRHPRQASRSRIRPRRYRQGHGTVMEDSEADPKDKKKPRRSPRPKTTCPVSACRPTRAFASRAPATASTRASPSARFPTARASSASSRSTRRSSPRSR